MRLLVYQYDRNAVATKGVDVGFAVLELVFGRDPKGNTKNLM